jgi:hypothetical protein
MNFDDPQVQEMVFVPVWELGQSNMEHDGGRSETGVAVLVYYESGRWWGIEEDGMVRSWHPESPLSAQKRPSTSVRSRRVASVRYVICLELLI